MEPRPRLADAVGTARKQRIALARRSFAAFLELCMTEEQSGEPLVLAPMHREWVKILRTESRALILAFVSSGKTSVVSVAYPLWRLGNDPSLRIGILRNGEEQAREIVRLLARHIEENAMLHEVFPHLVRDAPWNEGAVSIRRGTYAKDASVRAYGILTNLYGARLDLLICDDIVDVANSVTEAPRENVARKYFAEAQNRLLGSSKPQLLVIGTMFHRDDLYGRLIALGMPTFRFPAVRDDGTPQWPARWPLAKLAEVRRQVPSAEAARALDLRIVDEASAAFREEWIANAIARGEKFTTLTRCPDGWGLITYRPGRRIAIGCDPAVSKRQDSDLRAIAVVMLREDGRSKELLEVTSGRWSSPELVDRLISAYRRFAADICVVEGVGFQASLKDWVGKFAADANVTAYMTGAGALHLRHRVADLEIALREGEWLFPSIAGALRDAQTEKLVTDLRYYHRADHPPDRMVAVMLASWGLRQGEVRGEVGYVDLLSR